MNFKEFNTILESKKEFNVWSHEKQLFDFIEKNDVDGVRKEIHGYTGWERLGGVKTRLKDLLFVSPLSAAAYWGKFDVLKVMVEEEHCDVNIKAVNDTRLFETVLASACLKKNNIKIIQYLIDNGAKVNIPAKSSFKSQVTPVGAAIRAGNLSNLKCLVDNGADVNDIYIAGHVPENDSMKVLEYLYDQGYNFHKADEYGTAYEKLKGFVDEQQAGAKEYPNWTLAHYHHDLVEFLKKIKE